MSPAPWTSGARPKLLFLCQTLPYPPDGGVSIRTYHVMRLLAHAFDVTALCFFRASDRPTSRDVAASVTGLSEFATVQAFPIPQEHATGRLLWDHARSLLRGRAYTVFAYESRAFRARLEELLADESFDLVHMDSLDLSGYLPALRRLPIVCVHHNIEATLLQRRAGLERSRWRAAYIRHQSRLVEREARRWLGRVALNVAVSPADCDALMRLVPGARCAVVPNGVDVQRFQPAAASGTGIVGVGGINWFPNHDALMYLATELLPRLRTRQHPVVRWVGRASVEDQLRYRATYDIELPGYVDDVRPFVEQAACFVVPLRVGGGTRLKILVAWAMGKAIVSTSTAASPSHPIDVLTIAWAMGKAIVSTSIGCEGLAAVDGENILIRDTADGFAEAVAQVLADIPLRERLGRAGRATVEQQYGWELIGRHMVELYREVIMSGVAESASVFPAPGGAY